MEQILNQVINNFDFTLMISINVLTYIIVKILDEINGNKIVTTWQKRIVFLICSVVVGLIYIIVSDVQRIVIINSIIVAPVSWSWLAKPIAKRFGIDYKHLDRNAKQIKENGGEDVYYTR